MVLGQPVQRRRSKQVSLLRSPWPKGFRAHHPTRSQPNPLVDLLLIHEQKAGIPSAGDSAGRFGGESERATRPLPQAREERWSVFTLEDMGALTPPIEPPGGGSD